MATILVISSDRWACGALRGALVAQGHLVTVPRVGYRLSVRELS